MISEMGRAFSSRMDLLLDVRRWLEWKMKSLSRKDLYVGVYGSKKFKDFDLVLSLKVNKAGWFFLILCSYSNGRRGGPIICCPIGEDGYTN